MGSLKDDLNQGAQELRETHISWVFLHENDVFKVKKPVDFGFVDFSTAQKRRAACLAEVELNRRLAPDVYLEVCPVTRVAGRHTIGGDGPTVDWAVRMKRLPDAARGDTLLAEDRLGSAQVDRLARAVADFHAAARVDSQTEKAGDPSAIEHAVRENFEQAHPVIDEYLSARQVAEIEAWQCGFVEQHRDLLQARVNERRVREGHGDLKLEHVYFTGQGLSIIDCIEFNEAFRYLDVCSDVAFLSMDLSGYGRVDLAERLISTYARRSNDYGMFALIDFYESFRAYIRGKVAALLARDRGVPHEVREMAERQARRYLLLALASERRSLLSPLVVATGGLIGSGKSTLADGLGLQLGGAVVASDPIRKHLLGVNELTEVASPAFQGGYGAETSERVYQRLFDNARAVVQSGRPVVLDASFRSRKHRLAARELARSLGVPFRFVECRASPEVCRARLTERRKGPHVSDGRPEILDAFAESWEPVLELSESEHLTVDSSGPAIHALRALESVLPVWPEHL